MTSIPLKEGEGDKREYFLHPGALKDSKGRKRKRAALVLEDIEEESKGKKRLTQHTHTQRTHTSFLGYLSPNKNMYITSTKDNIWLKVESEYNHFSFTPAQFLLLLEFQEKIMNAFLQHESSLIDLTHYDTDSTDTDTEIEVDDTPPMHLYC